MEDNKVFPVPWLMPKVNGLFVYMEGKVGLTHEQRVASTLIEMNPEISNHIGDWLMVRVNSSGVGLFNLFVQEPSDWISDITHEVKCYCREKDIKVTSHIPVKVMVETFVAVDSRPFDKPENIVLNAVPSMGTNFNPELDMLVAGKGPHGEDGSYKYIDLYEESTYRRISTWPKVVKVEEDSNE